MKKKLFLLAAVVTICVACTVNSPETKELIGTWSEPYHVETYVKTITFYDDGTLVYTNKPDTTWSIVVDDAGKYAQLRYVASKHQLSLSGERIVFDESTSQYVREPFTFTTGYAIKGNVLSIDSFSYDGGLNSRYYKPLILYQQ